MTSAPIIDDPKKFFETLCHELGHAAAHPVWKSVIARIIHGVPGIGPFLAEEIGADQAAKEACGIEPSTGDYSHGVALRELVRDAVVDAHKPVMEAQARADSAQGRARFADDRQALNAATSAIFKVGRDQPQLLMRNVPRTITMRPAASQTAVPQADSLPRHSHPATQPPARKADR